MKVLFCNKYNFEFSGTEVYLFELMDLLRSHDHEIGVFSMEHPANRPSPHAEFFVAYADFRDANHGIRERFNLARRAIYSTDARKRLGRLLEVFVPDVAHVRNIYHHLSPSIYWELRRHCVPVVYHLNDFKLICPSYNLVSAGHVCERCRGGAFRHVVSERCHSQSLTGNLVLAAEAYLHSWLGTYRDCVNRFVAPSEFCRNKLVENGWPSDRIDVLYHFQDIPPEADLDVQGEYILYSGRLSVEKGIEDLLAAVARLPHVPLVVAGDGPQRASLEQYVAERNLHNVHFVGWKTRSDLYRLIRGARFTVMPSRVYETLGKVILESYALGRPVVATNLGTRPELVDEGGTGLLYEVANVDELAERIAYLYARPVLASEMGLRAQRLIRERHSPERHYEELMAIYDRARGVAA